MTTMTPAVRDVLAREARRVGIVDPGALELGEKLGLLDAVRVDAVGRVTGAAEAIRQFRSAKPHLFKPAPDVRAMTPSDYDAAKRDMLQDARR